MLFFGRGCRMRRERLIRPTMCDYEPRNKRLPASLISSAVFIILICASNWRFMAMDDIISLTAETLLPSRKPPRDFDVFIAGPERRRQSPASLQDFSPGSRPGYPPASGGRYPSSRHVTVIGRHGERAVAAKRSNGVGRQNDRPVISQHQIAVDSQLPLVILLNVAVAGIHFVAVLSCTAM